MQWIKMFGCWLKGVAGLIPLVWRLFLELFKKSKHPEGHIMWQPLGWRLGVRLNHIANHMQRHLNGVWNVIILWARLFICGPYGHRWTAFEYDNVPGGGRYRGCKICKVHHSVTAKSETWTDTHRAGVWRKIKHEFGVFDRYLPEVRDVPFGCMEMTFSGNRHHEEAEALRKASMRTVLSPDTIEELYVKLVKAGLYDPRCNTLALKGGWGFIVVHDKRELHIFSYPVTSRNTDAIISDAGLVIPANGRFYSADHEYDQFIHAALLGLLQHVLKQNLINNKENV